MAVGAPLLVCGVIVGLADRATADSNLIHGHKSGLPELSWGTWAIVGIVLLHALALGYWALCFSQDMLKPVSSQLQRYVH